MPNQSTKEEVDAILPELPFVDPASIKEYETKWIDNQKAYDIRFDCSHPQGEYCGSIVISQAQNKVGVISLRIQTFGSRELSIRLPIQAPRMAMGSVQDLGR